MKLTIDFKLMISVSYKLPNRIQNYHSTRTWIYFLISVTPESLKAMFVSFMSLFLSLLCGIQTIVTYVTEIFVESGSALSEINSSILISMATITSNVIFLYLVDRVNRRVSWNWILNWFIRLMYSIYVLDNTNLFNDCCSSQLLFIQHSHSILERFTRIRMDATDVCFIDNIFRFLRCGSNTIYYVIANISKEGILATVIS